MASFVTRNAGDASPGQAPSARPPRAGGALPDSDAAEPREEVAGKGSGETAGGSPALCSPPGEPSPVPFTSASDWEGNLSNTPSPKTTTGGEDWLSVNFYVNFPEFDDLSHKLDLAQAAAVDLASKSHSDETPAFNDVIKAEGIRFIVSPRGARLGGTGGLGMKWRLQSQHGLSVLIANMSEAHKSVPNVSVTATSLPLMHWGFDQVWPMMQDYIGALGGETRQNKLSRVDACVDLAGIGVEEFCGPFSRDWIVSRARQRDSYEAGLFASQHRAGRRPTGFAVGKSPLRLRVYDKLLESSKSPEKLALLVARRWGTRPVKATRVEVQISREKLKQLGVDSVEDWISKRTAILEKLTTSWFRITGGPVERNHADRSAENPIWTRTRNAFSEWSGARLSSELDPLPKLEIDTSKQMAQILGSFVGMFARVGKQIADNEMFFREVEFAIRDTVGRREMAAEVRRRALELGVCSSIVEREF